MPTTGHVEPSHCHFDLAIALAVLAADGQLPAADLAATGFIGELTLSGGLRSVPGVLPMVLAAAQRGLRRVFVPEPHGYVHMGTSCNALHLALAERSSSPNATTRTMP